MPGKELGAILLRLGTDKDFRDSFFEDKETTLSKYTGLSEEEIQCLRELTLERLPSVVSKLQRREIWVANDIRI